MFTVLIAEKEHLDAIRQENRLFFEPFLESKDLAFCCWNTKGQNLNDSVPDLLNAVGRRKEWRAVIINNYTPDSLKKRNPFDIVGKEAFLALNIPKGQPDPDESWDHWEATWKDYYEALASIKESVYREALENPLQKLSTWLCFRPENYIFNEVQEKHDVHDWAMQRLGRDDIKTSARLEFLEREQYKNELRLKEKLRREFVCGHSLNISNPTEVHCISMRTAENNFFDPDAYWNIYQESEYSKFADRNMYFDKMRFMVLDVLAETHRNYRTDYIRFLAAILIFASNPVPGSAMQTRHLYQLETETDDTPLCTLITSYDRKLAATSEIIENEMERIRGEIPSELTDKAAEALFCTPKEIAILLDESCDVEKVFAEKDYGLFFDYPENEYHKWNRNRMQSEKALDYIVKQRLRSVRKSVNQMNTSSEVSDVNINRLTQLQLDDIRDYTDNAEDEMIASIPPHLSDMSKSKQKMAKEADNVKKTINGRMTKKTTIILSVICLALYLCCFLPFLFSNMGTAKMVTTAIFLSLVMLGILAVVMFVSLLVLRLKVVNSVRGYNRAARETVNEIQTSLKRFSKYLSASYVVRRGHAVQNYAQKNPDEYTQALRIRKKHQEDIRRKRAYLAEQYGDYFGDKSICDETMSRPYDYDFDQRTEYEYPVPFLAGDSRQIEFISSGNFVTVPFSYVKGIIVRMEGIYEK